MQRTLLDNLGAIGVKWVIPLFCPQISQMTQILIGILIKSLKSTSLCLRAFVRNLKIEFRIMSTEKDTEKKVAR